MQISEIFDDTITEYLITTKADFQDLQYNTAKIVTPALFSYVLWILKQALSKKFKTLYFLARDGFIMHKIAIQMCEKFNLAIECKYLYCSRVSLRMPSYHIIGDEAYSLIFNGGYQISPFILLNRIGLSKAERLSIYEEISIADIDENSFISKSECVALSEKMKKSKIFKELLQKKSTACYFDTIEYLKQEGLFDKKDVVIVDSGWTGSMQRTLRQLINSAGSFPNVTGFYFGLYEYPVNEKDGQYLSWYFSPQTNATIKAKFNNNLFECMCCAPHEMTVSYECNKNQYAPVFKKNENSYSGDWDINLQIKTIVEVTSELLKKISFDDFNNDDNLKYSRKLMQKLMSKPSQLQAQTYVDCIFSDDVQEVYSNPIATIIEKSQWSKYIFLNRLINKVSKKNIPNKKVDNLFWAYGSVALSDIKFKSFYRFNFFLWDFLRMVKK